MTFPLSRALGVLTLVFAVPLTGCAPSYDGVAPVVGPKDTPESILGERLFREPRFSKLFVRETGGNPNGKLTKGDPALALLATSRRGELKSPFEAQSMSCVACHMVDDATRVRRAGMRGYADFAQRTPIPFVEGDSHSVTPRNSPTLLGAFLQRPAGGAPFLLHYDGEFATTEDLVIGGYTGRNFGWLPGERAEALANIVRVIREDDGSNPLAWRFSEGVAYREMFGGGGSRIAASRRLPEDSRIDVATASDQEILDRVARVVRVYLDALQFSTDPVTGEYNASPYDRFLAANRLPRKPDGGESDLDYAGRLAWGLQGLRAPVFVEGFGRAELEGARIFLARSKEPSAASPGHFQVGNCVACHAPPHFTDFKMHNTGETQDEYDSIHGAGAFLELGIPTLAQRAARHDEFLPATFEHPDASGRFRETPSAAMPGLTDLGAWNILGNPDFPAPQAALESLFCEGGACGDAASREKALALSVAAFKTPGLRGLSLSDPYMHTGRKADLGEVLGFYQDMSRLAREGRVRNADPELERVDLARSSLVPLQAFLGSLNEEYE